MWDRHIQALMDYVFRPMIDYTQRFPDFKVCIEAHMSASQKNI